MAIEPAGRTIGLGFGATVGAGVGMNLGVGSGAADADADEISLVIPGLWTGEVEAAPGVLRRGDCAADEFGGGVPQAVIHVARRSNTIRRFTASHLGQGWRRRIDVRTWPAADDALAPSQQRRGQRDDAARDVPSC
jgi:hypothetical protein